MSTLAQSSPTVVPAIVHPQVSLLHCTVGQEAADDADFALGIVRLNPERRVIYVNRAATNMSGGEVRQGRPITDLDLDDESRALLTMQLNRRVTGRGASYTIRFRRHDLGTWVRVLISAVPEYDDTGKLVSSIGYFIDKSLDAAALDIHRVIASARDGRELLERMTEILREVISFDSLIVTGISRRRQHLRRIFEHPTPPAEYTPTLWWPMPPFIKSMIDGCEVGPLDLSKWFASPEFAEFEKTDPTIAQFRERGFKQCLRIGVYSGEQLVAMVSLLSFSDRSYHEDVERCRRLPLGEAVNTALSFTERRDLRFGFEFVQSIALAEDDYHVIGQLLVNKLAHHYAWNHVSLFRLDKTRETFELVCQGGDGKHRIPDDYVQDSTKGLLGEALRTRAPVNIGYVQDPQHADRYHPILSDTRAEMVLPIPGTNAHWLLNVESDLRDAFADEEQESVNVQLQIAGFILERVASLEMTSAILRSVADAVIQTDDDNTIVYANPAAGTLLGRTCEDLLQQDLAGLVVVDAVPAVKTDGETGAAATSAEAQQRSVTLTLNHVVDDADPLPVKLRRPDGALIPALMSAAPLPQHLGGKVFVAVDMREQNRIQRMEVLRNVFHQLVGEIRVPLALSEAFLRDALRKSTGSPMQELVDKTLRQIQKADAPLERIMRLAASDNEAPLPRVHFDLREALRRLVAEFPNSEAEKIRLPQSTAEMSVQAPRHELMFCIRSLLTYLMRRKAQVERIEVGLERRGQQVWISMVLASDIEATGEVLALYDTGRELETVAPVLSNLLGRMGGGYAVLPGDSRGFELHFAAE